MRAAWYERAGPAAEVLTVGELTTLTPDPGEVRVRIHASGINPSDTKRRAGWRKEALEFPLIVPHSDGAGVIDAVGDDVPASRIGERVWLYNAQRGRAFGTAAEFCVLPSDNAVLLPKQASFVEGACLGVPAQTAHFAVTADGAIDGCTLLVQGGAGAVGHYAIQWAKRLGADVIATVSSEDKAVHARAAGADAVIDYRQEDVIATVRTMVPDGVDRIIEVDLGANMTVDAALIREGGVIASYSSTSVPEPVLPYYLLAYKGLTLRFVQAYILPPEARARAVADITEALIERSMIHNIAATLPLDEIAAAHELAEGPSHIGKVVVTI